MAYRIINQDITEIEADIIVNAGNGIGFMGGMIGKRIKCSGVAENIHYATNGVVEKEAKQACRKSRYIPRHLYGPMPGEVYVTSAGNLPAKHIIHAVTMRYPGTRTNLSTIESLLPKILFTARELGAKSIAIPLLGTGTGRMAKEKVFAIYKEYFRGVKDMDIMICCK